MPSSFFSQASRPSSGPAPEPLAPAAPWQVYRQHQQQPDQGPAGTTAPPAADLDPLDVGSAGDDTLDLSSPQDLSTSSGDHDDPPAVTTSTADPLRAERRRSNQLEKELRKARAQLARFSEINPDEYARLQDAERKREEFERQVADRERQLNEANLRRVRSGRNGMRPAPRCRTCARSACWSACSARPRAASAATSGAPSLTPS